MKIIAEIEGTNEFIAFGDTDHDGLNEVIMDAESFPHNYRIFEEHGNDLYSLEYTGGFIFPFATGDLDRDGKGELIGQSGGFVQVFESVDATSYPTQLVWSSPYLGNVLGMTAIGDTDRDRRMEIIHSQNSFGSTSVLLIYENSGDNAFSLVFSDTLYNSGSVGQKAIADFDGDGFTEIAFSGLYGRVYVYESTTDDTWRRVWTVSTGMLAAYAVSVGTDANGNGKPELFVMGSLSGAWTTMVYEASCNNTFVRTATLSVNDGFGGTPSNATVNLDNTGRQEYATASKVGWKPSDGRVPGAERAVIKAWAPGFWRRRGSGGSCVRSG